MTLALLFPGQGSQHVGMARALADAYPAAAAVLAEANDILGIDLRGLMFEGPEDELFLTKRAQPALLVHSVAALRVAQDHLGPVAMAAGHSLGEFSAHVAAGTISFEDALRTVQLRGTLMYEAGREMRGGMAAVLGLSDPSVVDVCSTVRAGVCEPANFNADGQVVISGDVAGIEEGTSLALDRGARKVIPLKVSGAFHSSLMEPAVSGLTAHLASVRFQDPTYPVVSNVTARPVTSGEEARDLLVKQLTAPVRWSASIAAMVAAGVDRFIEIGPGKVLSGLNRRNAKGLPCSNLGEPADFDALGGA